MLNLVRSDSIFIIIQSIGVQDLVTTRSIKKGEEITLSYIPAADEGSDERKVRVNYLLEWYGFKCNCHTCCLKVILFSVLHYSMFYIQLLSYCILDSFLLSSFIFKIGCFIKSWWCFTAKNQVSTVRKHIGIVLVRNWWVGRWIKNNWV